MSHLRVLIADAISPHPGVRKWDAADRVIAALRSESLLIEDGFDPPCCVCGDSYDDHLNGECQSDFCECFAYEADQGEG